MNQNLKSVMIKINFPELPDKLGEFIFMGMDKIYTHIKTDSDIHPCYDVSILKKYLPEGTYCDEPYLIKYEVGGCFPIHKDLKIMDNHIGAIILYPPCEFEGGELVIYTDPKIVIKNNSNTKEWILCMISILDEHEVLPITSGIRYCFLAPWFLD